MVFNPDRPFSFTTRQRLQGWQLECRVQIIKLLTSSCQIHDLLKEPRQILQCPQVSRTPCVNYYMSNMSFTSNSFTFSLHFHIFYILIKASWIVRCGCLKLQTCFNSLCDFKSACIAASSSTDGHRKGCRKTKSVELYKGKLVIRAQGVPDTHSLPNIFSIPDPVQF